MARRHPRFWEDLYADDYFKLELSKYDFKDANEIESSRTYCTREFFCRLSEITSTHTLILSNLSVRESSERTPRIIAGRALDLDISSFYARNLSEGFLRALFRECTLDAQFATFEGCIFPENTSEVGYFYLTLKGLPQDARPERMLKVFGGQELFVEACTCFDDSIIEYLADTSEENVTCPSRSVNAIFFTDCDGFTFASMMRLVEARRLATQREERLGPKISLLEKLSVRGQSPRLTEEQFQWFEANIACVDLPCPVP